MAAQLLCSSSRLSQTADEATHLYAGYRYLKCGDLTVSPEHPPLAKLIAAAPLLFSNFAVDCAPFKGDDLKQAFTALNWFYTQNWRWALANARRSISVFAVALCLLVWITARRMFGFATAIVACLLLIFEPNILAFGPLIMTDVPVTCTLLFAVSSFYLWVRHRTTALLLLTALAAGLTLLTKASGVVVMPILCLLAIADALAPSDHASSQLQPSVGQQSKWRLALRNLLAVTLICALAIAVLWLGYAMRFAPHPGMVQLQQPMPQAATFTERVRFELEKYHLLPQAYLEGFGAALALSSQAGAAFVAGKVYVQPPWFSTPLTFLIRNTVAMLALIIAAACGIVITFRQHVRERLFLMIPLAVYLAVSLHASSNVHIRYLLPIFPFLLIAVADGCVGLARHMQWMKYALLCLIALHAASSLHAYPNYLSYANELWGGPEQAYKYLPWLDIGQAYPEAKVYLERHPAENCWFLTGWQWNPGLYGVPCRATGLYLSEEMPPHVHGTMIVSSTLLTDVRLGEREFAAAFRNATPKAQIGGSALLVYEGDFDTGLNAAVAERNLARNAAAAGQASAALEHAQKAVDFGPSSPLAHADFCILLEPTRVDLAWRECSTARSLLLRDPLREEPFRKYLVGLLDVTLSELRTKYVSAYGREPETVPSDHSPNH